MTGMTDLVFDRAPWMASANCLGLKASLFFPEKSTGQSTAAQAKAVCAACVVRAECLSYALDNGVEHGIWGGLGVRDRRGLRSEMRRVS